MQFLFLSNSYMLVFVTAFHKQNNSQLIKNKMGYT